jgi:hypothetical protein
VKEAAAANHAPRVSVNGQAGTAPVHVEMRAGETIELSAAGSSDPDGNALKYRWFQYGEAGHVPGKGMAALGIESPTAAQTQLRARAACRAAWNDANLDCPSGIAHVILAVSDDASPRLTSYRRVIITVSK